MASNTVDLARQRVQNLQVNGIRGPRRILLAMLNNLLPPGLNTFASEINQCADDNQFMQLADHYVTTVFRPLKASGGATPWPSPSPITEARDEREELESCKSTRELEGCCLPRDNYKCIVTRAWSFKAPPSLLPIDATLHVPTQTCHIVPFALAHYEHSDQALNKTSSTWTSLCQMFPGLRNRIADNLQDINDPRNLFTAWIDVHHRFGNFELALEPLGQNRYKLEYWNSKHISMLRPHIPQDKIIQLTSNTNTPLPDPYLFQTHLIISRILHASGLGELLDKIIDDYSSLDGLAADGSTNIPFLIERSHPAAA